MLIVSRTALQEEKERIVVSLSEGNKTFESGLYRALVPSMTTIITSCLRRNELLEVGGVDAEEEREDA